MKPLEHLSQLALEAKKKKHPSIPVHAIPKPRYSDKDTNSLTHAIQDYVELLGGYCVRINTQGQYNEAAGRWTKSTTRKGTADLHACFRSVHISIEVKTGNDKLSSDQIQTREMITAAGGMYFEARNFESFYTWFNRQFMV